MSYIIKFKTAYDNNKVFRFIVINNIQFFDLRNFYSDFSNYVCIDKYYRYSHNTFFHFWLSLMWRGKAYRVRLFKKNNKFTLNFGYSHWTKILYNSKLIQFFKRRRQKYYVFF